MQSKKRPQRWEQRTLATLDLDTGEVTPGITVQVPVRWKVGAHMSTLQEAAKSVALDREITPTALRVLKYLEAILDYENAIRVVQADVARELGYHQPDVNKAFRLLLSKGIIERIESPSLKAVYRLNANYGWKGKHGGWQRARNSAPPLRVLQGGKSADEIAASERSAKEAKALELLDQFERNDAIERQRDLDALGEPRLFD